MDGGAGFDALAYTNSGAAVTVNLALGTASGGQANGDTFANIEQVFGSAFNDSLTGGSEDDAGGSSTAWSIGLAVRCVASV